VRLGLNLGYWGAGEDAANLRLAQAADRLGYAVALVAESWASDVVTVLTWVAAQTQRIDVGSGIMQIPARSPALAAMTAASLDALSGGRFRLGLGVSGPQVSEGWHGVPFEAPLGRTREYVDIVRAALHRRAPLRYAGEHYQLPLPGGPGIPLTLGVTPVRDRIPIYLAAIGPRSLRLAGELADGWLASFFAPEHAAGQLADLRAGRELAGLAMAGFEVVANVPLVVGPDVAAAADPVRPQAALYLGGMGSREQNFYNALARRMGYEQAAEQVQKLYLGWEHEAAAAAVPVEFIDETSLLGPAERIADRMRQHAAAGVTTLVVRPYGESVDEQVAALRTAVDALDKAGVGS
jgi:F420-dependent oxidoreductase-like protein